MTAEAIRIIGERLELSRRMAAIFPGEDPVKIDRAVHFTILGLARADADTVRLFEHCLHGATRRHIERVGR